MVFISLLYLLPSSKRYPFLFSQVQVGFRLCSELLHLAELLTAGEDAQREDVKLETRKHERRLHFKQDLIIQFSNNTIQVNSIFKKTLGFLNSGFELSSYLN